MPYPRNNAQTSFAVGEIGLPDRNSPASSPPPRAISHNARRTRPDARRARHDWLLLLLVASSGMTTMAVEMAASRLLGPYFGDSILVWANLIGLILIYLSLGAYLGGRWADRRPRAELLLTITALSAFWVGLIPLVAAPVLRLAQNAFGRSAAELAAYDALQIGGSFVSVLVLLAPPVILLGTVSPFAIRLLTRRAHRAGSSAGRVYALSTAGSIVGTFSPVLITIPLLGTARTFYLFGILLLSVSLVGLIAVRARRRALLTGLALALIFCLAAFLPPRVVKADERAIFETESRYNYIQVLQLDRVRYLMLNEGQGVHSIYDPDQLATFGTWDLLTIAPLIVEPPFGIDQVERICVIGLAGGTVARQATALYGPVPIDGVEIDPAIIDVGRRFFDMNQDNLHVLATDGRFYLENSPHQYDLIAVDAYRLPYIPFQLATSEFFGTARAHLTDRGVLAINVGRTATDYRMVEAMAATLGQHFAHVRAIDLADTFNTILIAADTEIDVDNLAINAQQAGQPWVAHVAALASENAHPLAGDGPVFTDDRAPVESLTNAIIVRYLLGIE
jgi:spermidine synthase